MVKRICICGKVFDGDNLWCSERCKYIVEKFNTPLGRGMDLNRAIRFFGVQYDKGDRL